MFCLKWTLRRKADTALFWWTPQHLQSLAVAGDQWQKQQADWEILEGTWGVPLSWGRAQWLWILVFSTWDVTQNFWTATLSISSRPSSENLTLISLSMLYRCISMYRTRLFLTPLKWMKVSVTQKMAFLALFVFNHGSWMHGWLENKNFTWQNKKLNYSLPFVFDDVHWNTKKNPTNSKNIFKCLVERESRETEVCGLLSFIMCSPGMKEQNRHRSSLHSLVCYQNSEHLCHRMSFF